MERSTIEKFTYEIESNALLDIFSTAGEEEVNKDNFEVLTNKNLTILILASGKGRSTIGDILSEMASSQALETLDKYQFHKKSPTEIVEYLKEMFVTINNTLVEYLDVADIDDGSTTLSIAVIYKNSLYTAHTGESRIYLMPRDETATLLSKDPSYSKRISKNTLSNKESSYYLGNKELQDDQVFVTEESTLYHRDTLFLCSSPIIESIPENKLNKDIEEIKELLEKTPPPSSASFLRYLHYERSVEVLRVEKEDIEDDSYEITEIDWERVIPILKKIALVIGVSIILLIVDLLFTKNNEKSDVLDINETFICDDENKDLNQTSLIPPLTEESTLIAEENSSIPKPKSKESIEVKNPIKTELKEEESPQPKEPEPLTAQTLKLIHKMESDVLALGTEGTRITFKENQLIASKEDLFYEKNKNSQTLYASLDALDSEIHGEIVDKLQKQYYSDSVVIRRKGEKIDIKIDIKASCHYSRSSWAKKSGLDLLTFNCEE